MPGSLKGAALAGGRWGALESVASQSLTLLTTAVLARILSPADFGIVAIAAVVVGFFGLITEAGFTAAIVRRPTINPIVLSSAFWLAAALGTLAAVLAGVLASPIASLFGDVEAAPFVAVSAISLVFGLAASVPKGLLLRSLRFRAVSLIAVLNITSYATTAIICATLLDLGAWSIIIGKLVGSAVASLSTFIAGRWRPQWTFRVGAIRQDLAFNAGFLGNRLVGYTAKNLDYWAVGRVLGSAILGAYYIAYIAPNLVRQRMTWVTQRALLPVFARIGTDSPRLVRAYLQVYRFTALIAMPALVGLAIVAEGAIDLVFGSRWATAAAPLSVLALAAAIESLHPVNATLFLSQGKPSLNLLVNSVRLVTLSIGLTFARQAAELNAYAYAVLAATTLAVIASQAIAFRRIPLRWTDYLRSLLPPTIATAIMALAVWGVSSIPAVSALGPSTRLLIVIPVGAGVYIGSGFGLFSEAFRSLLEDLRSALRRGETTMSNSSL
jgi:PST family polysaccharide transporter